MTNDDTICKLACGDLITSFAYAIDSFRYDDVLALLTDQAELVRGKTVLRGRDEILTSLRRRPTDQISRHIVSNVQVRPTSSTTAEGLSYVCVYRSLGNLNDVPLRMSDAAAFAEWRDRFERAADGWRLARREIVVVLEADAQPPSAREAR